MCCPSSSATDFFAALILEPDPRVDGRRESMNLGAFTAYVCREKASGERVELTLLRHGEEHTARVLVR